MPNKWTFTIKPIKALLLEEVPQGLLKSGEWCDPFAGMHSIATVTNDLNPDSNSIFHEDALEFLKRRGEDEFEGVLFDPPYSHRQASECYLSYGKEKLNISVTNMKYWSACKNEIARIIKPQGKAICFGWTSMGLGIARGFKMTRILLVPHGGSKNDTICTVEIKEKSENG